MFRGNSQREVSTKTITREKLTFCHILQEFEIFSQILSYISLRDDETISFSHIFKCFIRQVLEILNKIKLKVFQVKVTKLKNDDVIYSKSYFEAITLYYRQYFDIKIGFDQ